MRGMADRGEPSDWRPVAAQERYAVLDILRGVALMGVLLVNLMSDFRIPLGRHLLVFHTQHDAMDRAADVAVAALLEFKAMAIFSLLFGAGSALFAERAEARRVNASRFLARRYLVLLALGLVHLLLIWNGDILTLYAVCGLLLLPCLRLNAGPLAFLGIAAIALNSIVSWDFVWPGDAMVNRLAGEAQSVYLNGRWGDVLGFHARETRHLILPLLASSLPKTFGLMALGAAVWRWDVFRAPQRQEDLLWAVVLLGGCIGVWATIQTVMAASTGHPSRYPSRLLDAASSIPLALAFASGLLLALQWPLIRKFATVFQPAGQMALTNYLTQSVLLSLLFYGYGLGLFGRLGSASAAGVGLLLYAVQLELSAWWLRHYQFGPVEWLWRSLTYGRRQPWLRCADRPENRDRC